MFRKDVFPKSKPSPSCLHINFVHIIVMSVPNMEEDRLVQHLCNVIIYVYHNRFNQGLTRLDKPLVQL